MAHDLGKKGEELVYWDGREQATVANWVDVEDHQLPPATKLIFEMVIKPNNGLAPDQGVVAEAEAKLGNVLDVLMGTPAKKLIESRPRAKAWCYKILARPAWAKVLEMKHKAQV
ncbi:hypothetical protein CMV_021387 [Castanea mollissima]|uniref:glutathione transferase n=1 Tax=Castanea mollissima TaxID=60419 RepID=A0A8J4VCP3_9ROSI|nr:hypothetical protein CMV_021387 [Castanea mollissima]